MPPWMLALYAPWMPKASTAAPFVPTFETIEDVSLSTGAHVLNTDLYATDATARALMQKFGASRIELRDDPTSPDGGNIVLAGDATEVSKPAKQRFLIFAAGCLLKDAYGNVLGVSLKQFEINAGILADYFQRMPEAQFPAQTMLVGWPPQPLNALSAAERDAWRVLQGLAGL